MTEPSPPPPSRTTTDASPGMYPRAGVVIGALVGVVCIVAGLIVGFTDRTPVACGSVLGGGSHFLTDSELIRCGRALSTPATWTWILFAAAALSFAVGLLITVMMKNAERARAQ